MNRASSCIARSLKASVGPVKQLQDEKIVVDLLEGRDRLVPEVSVGRLDHAVERRTVEIVADVGTKDGLGDIAIGLAREGRDLLSREKRIALREIKAAVARETGQHGLAEGQDGCIAPCGDVVHDDFRIMGTDGDGRQCPAVGGGVVSSRPSFDERRPPGVADEDPDGTERQTEPGQRVGEVIVGDAGSGHDGFRPASRVDHRRIGVDREGRGIFQVIVRGDG